MPGRAGRQALLFTFVAFSGVVAFSGDNATDAERPAAVPDGQSGGVGGRSRE
jgi:hypothetical protein